MFNAVLRRGRQPSGVGRRLLVAGGDRSDIPTTRGIMVAVKGRRLGEFLSQFLLSGREDWGEIGRRQLSHRDIRGNRRGILGNLAARRSLRRRSRIATTFFRGRQFSRV